MHMQTRARFCVALVVDARAAPHSFFVSHYATSYAVAVAVTLTLSRLGNITCQHWDLPGDSQKPSWRYLGYRSAEI